MVPISRLLGILFFPVLCAPFANAQQDTTARFLWDSFQETYRAFAIEPLEPAVLEAKAKAALIQASGPRFHGLESGHQTTFLELVDTIVKREDSISGFERVEMALETLLPEIDRYGSYQAAADVAQLNEALKQAEAGGSVHMTLDNSREGEILCYPYEGGPAQLAGIGNGARLLEVDGRSAEGKSLHSLRLAFVGPPDTVIEVKVLQPQGKIEIVKMTRTSERLPSVSVENSPLGVTLRITKFENGTASQTKAAMQAHGNPARLTIDLRGNGGGLRDEALKVASLFFPEGTILATFTTQSGEQKATDGNGVLIAPGAIRILQNGRTASAAEYLAAVLKEGLPEITTVFGEKSYGKSHSTVLLALSGGGQVSMTEALLATGSGVSWDKTGIVPDHTRND